VKGCGGLGERRAVSCGVGMSGVSEEVEAWTQRFADVLAAVILATSEQWTLRQLKLLSCSAAVSDNESPTRSLYVYSRSFEAYEFHTINMADARALLRQQRAARKEAQKPQKQSAASAPAPVSKSKKRKAADESVEERKRTRTEEEAGVPAGFFDAGDTKEDEEVAPAPTSQESAAIPDAKPLETPKAANLPLDAAAEAELDAFMDEIAAEKPMPPPRTTYSGAVVEAAPMTAAQAREDQSAQRAKRDEDMEGEKEDAARALEDEFEEMEGLEERVKRLRKQREAVRTKSVKPVEAEIVAPAVFQPEVDGDSEEDDEDWDDWRFRPA
jgi:hypothetical protein